MQTIQGHRFRNLYFTDYLLAALVLYVNFIVLFMLSVLFVPNLLYDCTVFENEWEMSENQVRQMRWPIQNYMKY